jgi:hypothetical protein
VREALREYAEPGRALAACVQTFVAAQSKRRAGAEAKKTKRWLEQTESATDENTDGSAANAQAAQPRLTKRWLEQMDGTDGSAKKAPAAQLTLWLT